MKVSIVITAYNVEQWIRQAIVSALQQKHLDDNGQQITDNRDWTLEVVVVNDASTDGTGSVINDIAVEHDNMTVVTNEVNQGAGMSRRIGIAASTGDYILLLDGDDYILPTLIASLVYSAKKYDADIVSGGITILRDEKVGYFDQTCYGNFIACGANKVTNFYKERIVFMNNKLIRRRLHEQVPYCTRRYIEDTPVIAKMLYLANKVVYTNNPGYVYRMQPQSLTHTSSKLKGAVYRALCMIDLVEFYKDKGKPYTDLFSFEQFMKIFDEVYALRYEPDYGEYKQEIQLIKKYRERYENYTEQQGMGL